MASTRLSARSWRTNRHRPAPKAVRTANSFSRILSAAERHSILHAWNDTAQPLLPTTVPELFGAQAARTPDAVAVVFGEETLRYG